MAEKVAEVLVVGAGPTGLMAALLLARSGVAVRIVEKRGEPTRESRAFAMQSRTLELMRSLGLAERFLAAGVRVDSVDIHVRGRYRGGPDFTRARADDTPFPFILMIPQSRTEAILIDACEAAGVVVERGVEAVEIEQDEVGVTAHTASHGIIRATYVVGGDGSHSTVRRAAGLDWTGDLLPQRFLLADCRVDWPFDHDHFRVFLNGPLIGLFLPLDGARLSRVMATDTSGGLGDEDASTPAPLDLSEMQAGLEAALALPVRLSGPVWVTRYRAHHRHVDRYRGGRAFVAGDAAHIHSPAGGQGMNTGLQDAANLAWKLAAVLHGNAPDALLDSYDAERRPVGDAVVRSTGRLFAAAAAQSGWRSGVRDRLVSALLPIVSRVPAFHVKAFRNISECAIAYPAGPFVTGAGAGTRVPDAGLGNGRTLFDLIGGYRFTVLVASGRSPGPDERAALATIPAAVEMVSAPVALARLSVASGGQATIVVRPDGYVAWRADRLDPSGALAALTRLGAVREDRRVDAP